MESRKMVPKNLFAGQKWRKRHREQTYGHGERGGEGEMYGKSNMETYITICKIHSPCVSFLSDTANSCWLSILQMVM